MHENLKCVRMPISQTIMAKNSLSTECYTYDLPRVLVDIN